MESVQRCGEIANDIARAEHIPYSLQYRIVEVSGLGFELGTRSTVVATCPIVFAIF